MSEANLPDSVERILRELEKPAEERKDQWRERMARLKALQERNDAAIERNRESFKRTIERLRKLGDRTRREIRVNKRTHRVRFEDETEDGVTIVIEKRED